MLAFTLGGLDQLDALVATLAAAPAVLDGLAQAAQVHLAGQIQSTFEAELRRQAPVGKGETSGQLRDSLAVTTSTQGTATVLTGVGADPPLSFVLYGTRPHVIEPKTAQALAFTVGGTKVFAKRVNHPGTKANDFVTRSWLAIQPSVAAALDLAAEEIKVGFHL